MDSKNSCHTICEAHNATVSEELLQGELEPDTKHDRITRLDIQDTSARVPVLNKELKAVDDALISELTTVATLHLTPCPSTMVPLSRLYWATIGVIDDVSTCSVVLDSDNVASCAWAGIESELLLVRRGASELNRHITVGINDRREPAFTLLACIEAIPTVVHIRV